MKQNFGLRKVMLALTTLTLVGLSSCRDQDFDWNEAHATQQYEKFTNVFIKEFGQPAEGHQWGFDAAQLAMSGAIVSSEGTRASGDGEYNGSYKQEMKFTGNIRADVLFGHPKDITPREHLEVYAWFTMHKVNWTNTPATYNKDAGDISLSTSTRQSNGIAYARNLMASTDPYYLSNEKVLALVNDIAKKENIIDTKNGNKVFQLDRLSYLDSGKNPESIIGNYAGVGFEHKPMSFKNAWFQNVANDNLADFDDDEYNHADALSASWKMDQFTTWLTTDKSTTKWEHTLDWNGGIGYGWYRQPSTDKNGIYPIDKTVLTQNSESSNQNATLFLNCDLNVWTYHCSEGNTWHDKYYIVYLKGEDYEGYYLGFDLESNGSQDNMKVSANGVCNDIIIKLVDCGPISYSNSRIMCEDLGGSQVTASDIDYNDLVLDVTCPMNAAVNSEIDVKLTVQAAGGTMPLVVFYDQTPLFEVHEFLLADKVWDDNDHVQTTNPTIYRTMINTLKETNDDLVTGLTTVTQTKDYCLSFNKSSASGQYGKAFANQGFDLQKLKIKVYRPFTEEQGRVEDYISQPAAPTTEAYWVTLDNMEGEAPLKICVPQYVVKDWSQSSVKWLKERRKISDTYTNFTDWVKNPNKTFWAPTSYWNPVISNTQNLYQ